MTPDVAKSGANHAWSKIWRVGNEARFRAPWGVAAGPNGTIMVADTDNHTIRRIAADGTVTTLAGVAGVNGFQDSDAGVPAVFNFPVGIAVDENGTSYVADRANQVFRRVQDDVTDIALRAVLGGGFENLELSILAGESSAAAHHHRLLVASARALGTNYPFVGCSARKRR